MKQRSTVGRIPLGFKRRRSHRNVPKPIPKKEEKSGQLPQVTYVFGTDAPASMGSIGLLGGAVGRIFWIVYSETHMFAIRQNKKNESIAGSYKFCLLGSRHNM
ncbi:unnamed protein product [Clavelina lepadiformis]|uniref:Uncharacterized protein n=1 Tax=Clavelina lepadiformis TaxID=159417 RepID=A0ABP0FGN6_CLALP